MSKVMEKVSAYAERVEKYMETQVSQMEQNATGLSIEKLYQAMRHSLTAGGKRIRPAMIYAFCEACGGELEKADSSACAMEMTHTSSLIFDDLPAMDNDDMRRGKPSCHKAFGEATAILAGDALICAPFAILTADTNLTADQKVMLISTLSTFEGANGMVGGQQMDMQFETQEQVTVQELQTMCSGKTGALMAAACRMGCLCGNGTRRQFVAAGNYGLLVGLAFQVIDDILDVTSTEEELGKPIGSDAEENKTTFVTLLGIEKAKIYAGELTKQAHSQLDTAFAEAKNLEFLHDLTDELLKRVK
ncbi:MAG: farnesyl diphosphate synthase [Oscillospiraceae bacterium]